MRKLWSTFVGIGSVHTLQRFAPTDSYLPSSDSLVRLRRGPPTRLLPNEYLAHRTTERQLAYGIDQGGSPEDKELSIGQRGFLNFVRNEAKKILKPEQVLLNTAVKSVSYSGNGVTVKSANGSKLSTDYALKTFSLGIKTQRSTLRTGAAFVEPEGDSQRGRGTNFLSS